MAGIAVGCEVGAAVPFVVVGIGGAAGSVAVGRCASGSREQIEFQVGCWTLPPL